jgi:hypothetical protein
MFHQPAPLMSRVVRTPHMSRRLFAPRYIPIWVALIALLEKVTELLISIIAKLH